MFREALSKSTIFDFLNIYTHRKIVSTLYGNKKLYVYNEAFPELIIIGYDPLLLLSYNIVYTRAVKM